MITADLDSFPEHRVGFYDLMHSITTNCFEACVTPPLFAHSDVGVKFDMPALTLENDSATGVVCFSSDSGVNIAAMCYALLLL